MAEAVNCISHYYGQQGHRKTDCPTRRIDLEAKEIIRSKWTSTTDRIALPRSPKGGGGAVEAKVEVAMNLVGDGVMEAIEVTKDAAATAMVGDVATVDWVVAELLGGDWAALDLVVNLKEKIEIR